MKTKEQNDILNGKVTQRNENTRTKGIIKGSGQKFKRKMTN